MTGPITGLPDPEKIRGRWFLDRLTSLIERLGIFCCLSFSDRTRDPCPTACQKEKADDRNPHRCCHPAHNACPCRLSNRDAPVTAVSARIAPRQSREASPDDHRVTHKEKPRKPGFYPWWFEEAYARYPRSYITVVVGASILWFLFMLWMSVRIGEGGPPEADNLPLDFFTYAPTIAISVCLCLQLLALPYLLSRLRTVFDDLIPESNDPCEDAGICLPLYNFSSRCRWFYVGGGLLMLPLLAILLAKVWNAFDRVEHTQIAWVLDVSNTFMVLLQVYLLLVNIWILIVMAWVLHRLRSRGIIDKLDKNPHSPDRMGGLGPLHEVLTYFLSVYFASMVWLIVWYIATEPPAPKMLIILAYLGLGLALLYYGFRSVHRLYWHGSRTRSGRSASGSMATMPGSIR